MTEGPRIHLNVTCHGCSHELAVRYQCQSDWGYDYYCTHPTRADRSRYANSIEYGHETPGWCPLRETAIAAYLEGRK